MRMITSRVGLLPIVILAALLCLAAISPSQPYAQAADDKDSVAEQVKVFQKQVAELQARLNEMQKVRIVAAGTATWTRPQDQANKTTVRVKLPADVTAQLGKDYIVLLTNRFPTGGYPYFAPFWKTAPDGFDITLVDPALGNGESASYDNPNKTYGIDWVVVKKGQ
jgi:hypothetical protein